MNNPRYKCPFIIYNRKIYLDIAVAYTSSLPNSKERRFVPRKAGVSPSALPQPFENQDFIESLQPAKPSVFVPFFTGMI